MLNVRERHEASTIAKAPFKQFEAQLKQWYGRVFTHYFNYETKHFEESPKEQHFYLPAKSKLRAILNVLTFYPRREFRRRQIGKK